MKLPNKYGAVVKLSGKRRKPYAVRISAGYIDVVALPNKAECYPFVDKYNMVFRKGKNYYAVDATDRMIADLDKASVPYRIIPKRKFKYLEYFEKSADAYAYLAKMNNGDQLKGHVSVASEPLFKDIYEEYIEFAMSLKKKPSEASLRSYKQGFMLWQDVHDIRFTSVTTKQLQTCLTKYGDMSKSTVGKMITILKRMYKYALANQICETDLSPYLFAEHTDKKVYVHTIFTDDEIEKLWTVNDISAWVTLILIYTGMRCSEFLEMKTENVHIKERYMLGGMKTAAGRDRIIPIHKRIVPLVKKLYRPENTYLYQKEDGMCYGYPRFRDKKWNQWMNSLGMNHYTHDCRHTCSTKLEQAGVDLLHRKLILGHSIRDITEGTYTHVDKKTLISDMDLWQ